MALTVVNVTLQQPTNNTGWRIIEPNPEQKKRLQELFAVPFEEDVNGRDGLMSENMVFGAGWRILELATEMGGGRDRGIILLLGGEVPLPIIGAIAQLTVRPMGRWRESRVSCAYLENGMIVYTRHGG